MTLFGRPLHVWIIGALVLGVVAGLSLHLGLTPTSWARLGVGDVTAYLSHTASDANASAGSGAGVLRFVLRLMQFVGDVFLRLLRLLAVPVVLFSVIGAVAGVGSPKRFGRMGLRTLVIFLLTTMMSVGLAVVMASVIRPGTFVASSVRDDLAAKFAIDASQRAQASEQFTKAASAWTQVLDVLPANPFRAMADGSMLQIISFAVLLGLGLLVSTHAARGRAIEVIEALADACLRLVQMVMYLAPLAVLCLTTTLMSKVGVGVLGALAALVVCVLVGLAIIIGGFYPLLLRTVTGKGPRPTAREFFRALTPAQLLAFSSSSSAATMPVTMECCDAMGVPRRVSGFVVPLGTTINMDGTAFYQVMCVTFLAQAFGVTLAPTDYLLVALLAVTISIGSPGLPGSSLVLMVFVLEAFRIPAEGLALIIAVDRLLDMARTVANVSGDALCAAIVASHEPVESAGEPAASRT